MLTWVIVDLHSTLAQTNSVNINLQQAYRRLQFDQLYPPEAVSEIQTKLTAVAKPVEVLAQLAKDSRPEVRVLVAMLLGELGDTEGGKVLWQLLRDDEENVRLASSGAIVRLSQLTPVVTQVDGLQDRRAEVRQVAAATLGKLRDRAAEQGLIEVLSDTNAMVRMEVARALGACGTAPQSVPALEKALKDSSVLVRTSTAKSLGVFIDPLATSALLSAMDDTDWHVRAAAALSLRAQAEAGPSQRATITAALIPKLQKDPFALVRDRSADALTYADDDHVVQALVDALLSDQREVRFHATRSIIVAKAVKALPLLSPHVDDKNPGIRQAIIQIYGAIGGETQIPAVIQALNDPEPEVKMAAIQSFRQLGSRIKPNALISGLNDKNPHVRAAAARVLGDLGDRTVSSKLLPMLKDENDYVRGSAAEALGKLGDRSAIQPLIEMLTGQAIAGKTNTTEEGLLIGPNKDDPFLAKLSQETVQERKTGAVKALGVLRATEAVNPIIEHGLRSDDPQIRAVSAYALGQIGDRHAVVPLEDTIKPYYAATKLNYDNVISLGASTVPDVVRQKEEKEIRVRASVVWALGQIGDPAARDTLLKAADDNNSIVRDQAVEALQRLKEQEDKLALAALEKKVAAEKKAATTSAVPDKSH
jgi:HEAT repeat protein